MHCSLLSVITLLICQMVGMGNKTALTSLLSGKAYSVMARAQCPVGSLAGLEWGIVEVFVWVASLEEVIWV